MTRRKSEHHQMRAYRQSLLLQLPSETLRADNLPASSAKLCFTAPNYDSHIRQYLFLVIQPATNCFQSQTSWDGLPLSPVCLEWSPKLNRKVSLHVLDIPPRFFATPPHY